MLKGEPATEQCIVVNNVNFLNNADIDGKALPPNGAPNIMMAAGGTQLDKKFEDDVVDVWQFRVDWKDPSKTTLAGPAKIKVAPYRYLCDGQLTNCVPQPGTERRLDAQGDKIMARLVYRRVGNREMLVAVHSVNTSAGAGGVRWYEFAVDRNRAVTLRQQGTYAPDGFFRWMASPAVDATATSGSAIRSAARRTSPASASRRDSPTIRPASSPCARPSSSRAKRRRPTRFAGRTTRRRPSILPTTARFGTSATT